MIEIASFSMNMHRNHLLLCALVIAPWLEACAVSTTSELIEMSITQEVELSFRSMTADQPAEETFSLRALSSAPDLAANRERLQCAVVDWAQTRATVSALDTESLETHLSITTEFQSGTSSEWVPLLGFNGSIEPSTTLEPETPKPSLGDEEALQVALLSEDDELSLRVEAQTTEDVSSLRVNLVLVLAFSSEPGGCSDLVVSSSGDQGAAPVSEAR